MPARNEGKTNAELGISQVEREALQKLAPMLRSGKIHWGHGPRTLAGDTFNMEIWVHHHRCGTVGCMAWWANKVSGGQAFPWVVEDSVPFLPFGGVPGLMGLFLPSFGSTRSPAAAAEAIDSFLRTGHAQWEP